jgi:hypothetical protein
MTSAVSWSVRVKVAPGTAAPEGSVTTPEMVAPNWARAGIAKTDRKTANRSKMEAIRLGWFGIGWAHLAQESMTCGIVPGEDVAKSI